MEIFFYFIMSLMLYFILLLVAIKLMVLGDGDDYDPLCDWIDDLYDMSIEKLKYRLPVIIAYILITILVLIILPFYGIFLGIKWLFSPVNKTL